MDALEIADELSAAMEGWPFIDVTFDDDGGAVGTSSAARFVAHIEGHAATITVAFLN